jgi:hypothetical protein
VLRKMFGFEMEEKTAYWRKLYDEELHIFSAY